MRTRLGILVLASAALMVSAILYAAFISLRHWSGISV